MFFDKTISSTKQKVPGLKVLNYHEFSTLSDFIKKYDFADGLELRLNDKDISAQELTEVLSNFDDYTGSKLVFNFTGCAFTGNIGNVIASFFMKSFCPSELKFYFSNLDYFPGLVEMIEALKDAPQKIVSFDFDYSSSIMSEEVISLLTNAIEHNFKLTKFSLNLDATDITIGSVNTLVNCLAKCPYFLLYAYDCDIEEQDPKLFRKIVQLTKNNKDYIQTLTMSIENKMKL